MFPRYQAKKLYWPPRRVRNGLQGGWQNARYGTTHRPSDKEVAGRLCFFTASPLGSFGDGAVNSRMSPRDYPSLPGGIKCSVPETPAARASGNPSPFYGRGWHEVPGEGSFVVHGVKKRGCKRCTDRGHREQVCGDILNTFGRCQSRSASRLCLAFGDKNTRPRPRPVAWGGSPQAGATRRQRCGSCARGT